MGKKLLIYGIVFCSLLAVQVEARRVIEPGLLEVSEYALELEGFLHDNQSPIESWPSQDEIRGFKSPFTRRLLILPYYVSSLNIDEQLKKPVALLYVIGYYNSLLPNEQKEVREDLANKDNASILNLLDRNCHKRLEKVLDNLNLTLTEEQKKELIAFVTLRDRTIATSRALKIGLKAFEEEVKNLNNAEGFDLPDSSQVLPAFQNHEEVLEVVYGLKPIAEVKMEKDEAKAVKLGLWLINLIEGLEVDITEGNDGNYIVYDRRKILWHLCENVEAYGLKERLYELLSRKSALEASLREKIDDITEKINSIDYSWGENIKNMGKNILLARGDFVTLGQIEHKDDNTVIRAEPLWEAGSKSRAVFELEWTAPEAVYLATVNRVEALKRELTIELENYGLFNHYAPIVVIDDSREEIYKKNDKLIKELSKKYGISIHHLSKDDRTAVQSTIAGYIWGRKENGNLDPEVEDLLRKNDVNNLSAFVKYLKDNIFHHISGVRNFTFLLAINEEVIMNVDDDAPAEVYISLTDEPKEEITLSDLYLFPYKFTHQRYESLTLPFRNLLTSETESATTVITDFVYGEGRQGRAQEERRYIVLPVNVFAPIKYIGEKVGEAKFPIYEKDLRGTVGKPLSPMNFGDYSDKVIHYIAYPFIFDQDTSEKAQITRYLDLEVSIENKKLANVQHTNRMALIPFYGLVRGFVGLNALAIFNRGVIYQPQDKEISLTPSGGRDLRLEEPPYIKAYRAPIFEESIILYSPVGGGQQRSIAEREYVMSKQGFTEVVGGVARHWYEKALELYRSDPKVNNLGEKEKMRLLGEKFIEVAKEIDLSENLDYFGDNVTAERQLLSEREFRRAILVRLGAQIAQLEEMSEGSEEEKEVINGMKALFLQYAVDFYLYRPSEDQNQNIGCFWKIWWDKESGTFRYQEVYPDMEWKKVPPRSTDRRAKEEGVYGIKIIMPEDKKEVVSWQEESRVGMISEEDLRNYLQEGLSSFVQKSELGEYIDKVIEELKRAEGNNPAVIPAFDSRYEDQLEKKYLTAAMAKISDSIRNDGELFILWPDIVEAAVQLGGWRAWVSK